MNNEWASLKVSKQGVASFWGLSNEVYDRPEMLEAGLESLLAITKKFEVKNAVA